MKRVARIAGGVVTVGSLVLGVWLIVVWVGSYRAERRWGVVTAAGRYTVHVRGGRVVVTGPPPEARGAGVGAARGDPAVLGRVTNDSFYFQRLRHGLKDQYVSNADARPAMPGDGMRAWMLVLGSNGFNRELLRLLEDPERFVAGHCLLVGSRLPAAVTMLGKRIEEELPVPWMDHQGLRVELREDLAKLDVGRSEADEWRLTVERFPAGAWWCEPGQMAVVRDMWHDRLDVAVVSGPVWPGVVGCLVLPGVWGYRRVVRGVRRRAGCCVGCGYDLRGTPGRCPECGSGAASGRGGRAVGGESGNNGPETNYTR